MKTNHLKPMQYLTLLSALFMVSCGGGGGGPAVNGLDGTNLVATVVQNSAPLSACPNGGITVNAGIDSNGNKALDPSEVTTTQYVCNGTSGSIGLSTLVQITNEAAGTNCATSGKKVSAGQDANSDNVLDTSEITSTAYVCNGANGANGNNGLNSLISIVPEPAGLFCTYGGNKTSSGFDANANGVLDSAEITAGISYYICNGPPGQPIPWVDVTGIAVQAISNTSYLANSAVQITITLPTAPVVGDVVQVSGIGSGGWKVAQNAGQYIITKDLTSFGALWTPHDINRTWRSVASSADGIKLVAADYGGQLYTSTDAGMSWTAHDTARNWGAVASSADGTKLVAADHGGQIYTSTNSGGSWAANDSARVWSSVASSADGSKLVAAVSDYFASISGQIYTSTDSGANWTPRESARIWSSVASSSDGTMLVAADSGSGFAGGQLYTSTDAGANWTPRESARIWSSVASSSDGTKLVAAAYNGRLYTSTDAGGSWTPRDANRFWISVASSADGTKLVAADSGAAGAGGGRLYTSTDSGVTWTARDTSRNWSSVASSADGIRLVAAVTGGQLYTSAASTSIGITGSISGAQYDAIELQYIGNNTFMVLSHAGNLEMQ